MFKIFDYVYVITDDKAHLMRAPSDLEKELALLLRDRGDTADSSVSAFRYIYSLNICHTSWF